MHSPATSFAPRRTELTRRRFLLVAGGVGVAAFLRAAPSASADDTADAARLATLAALLSAVACGPAGGMTEGVVQAYVDRYAAYSADADPYFRSYADAALDDI